MTRIAVVDYGAGNLVSIEQALSCLLYTSDAADE